MALSKRTYFGFKRGLVITLLVALNASSLPIAIRAFEVPEEVGAAENVVFNINVDLNPQRGPFLDCGGGTFCNPADQWDGPGRLAPEEVMSNLKQGQIVRIHSITGDVEWGGGDGYQNPASCKDSPHPILAGTPKHLVVFQFTDNQNRVVPAGVPTPNGTNAIPARDFIGQGIPVPAGATKMFASYPDSRYNDNHQRCHIQGVLVETVPDPTPPPTTPPPPPGACTPQNATFVSQKVIRADNASHAGSSPVNGTRLPAGTYLVEYRDGEWSAWGTDDDPLAKGLPWLGHVNVAYQTNAGLAQTTAGANGAFLTAAEAKAAGKDKFVTVSISDSGTDNLFVYFRDDHIPDNRNQVRYGIYRCDEPTVPTPPPTGACTPQNATFMYDKVIRAVNTDHAGSTPVNGTRLPVGTYLVEYRDGEWSAWGRDDDPLANGLPWLGYVDVAHLTNGGLVHTLAGAGGAFLTPAEAKAAGKGKFVTVTVDASTSENLFVYFKDHFVDDNRNQIRYALYRCDELSPAPTVQLQIEKTAPETVKTGETAVFTIKVTNIGQIPAENFFVWDPLPNNIFAFDPSKSDSSCRGEPNRVVCENLSLQKGQSKTLKIAMKIPETFTCPLNMHNIAYTAKENEPSYNAQTPLVPFRVECGPKPVLKIEKTGPATALRGSNISYNVKVTNQGDGVARDVVAIDRVPQGFEFVSSGTSSECSFETDNVGPLVACRYSSLSAGSSRTAKIVFKASDAIACGATVMNQADVLFNTDTIADWSKVMTVIECPPKPDVDVEKTGPATVRPGENVVYKVKLTNNGPGAAQNLSVIDRVPAGLTFTSQGTSPACVLGADQAGQLVECTLSNLNASSSHTFTIVFTARNDLQCGATIVNQATVQGANIDPASSTAQVLIDCPKADLEINKTGPATVTAGSVVKYQLTVKNLGNDDATNVVVADPIPTGVTFNAAQSSNGCVQNGANILCDNLTLSSGQSKTFTVAFDVPAVAQCDSILINRASVSGSQTDPNPSNNQSQVVTTKVECEKADLSIEKTGDASVRPGNVIVYSVTVRNAGPATAQNVIVTDPIPAGLTFRAGQSSGSCVQQGVNVVCSTSSLGSNQSATFKFAFDVPASAQCDAFIQNVAGVSSSTLDPQPGNNQSQTVSTLIDCPKADLEINKTGPATVTAGSVVKYQLTVKNLGNDDATNVVVADPIPTGVTFNAAQSSAGCVQNGANILCDNLTLSSGQSKTFTVAFDVPAVAQCDSILINRASVSGSQTDPNPSNNQSQVVTTSVQCLPVDLSIVKQGPATVAPGAGISYTLTVKNDGPADAANVTVTDRIPSGLTFNPGQSDNRCTQQGPDVVCAIPSLTKNASTTLTLSFHVSPQQQCSSTIVNRAEVWAANQTDANQQNNVSQNVSTQVKCPEVDVSITKSGPATVMKGGTVAYTLTASNAGPDTASNVIISDPIPAGLTFNPVQSGAGCIQNGGVIDCAIAGLASGQSKSVTLVFNVPQSVQCSSVLYNTASVSSSELDRDHTNNQSTVVSTLVQCPTPKQADLSIIKKGPATAVPGGLAVYTLHVTNLGPDTATGVTVTDQIPAGVTFNATFSDASCTQNAGTVTCGGFTLAKNQTRIVTVAFAVPFTAQCGGFIHNAATVSGAQQDPSPFNNQSQTVTTTIQCPKADLSITKSGPATATQSGTIIYTLVASNAGPGSASGVLVTDQIPSGLTFDASQSDGLCVQQGFTVACGPFTLASGTSRTLKLAFDVPSSAQCASSFHNVAEISGNQNDPSPSNNTSTTVKTTVQCDQEEQADVSIVKSGPQSVLRGGVIVYTLTASNSGPSTAEGVRFIDHVPAGLTFHPGQSDASCSQQSASIVCGTFTLPSGQSKSVSVAFTVPSSAQCNATIRNDASVTAFTLDPHHANNDAYAQTQVDCPAAPQADVSISKSGPAQITRGQNITYVVTASNNGPATATGVVVKDVIPAGLTFVSAQSDASCAVQGAEIVCQPVTLNPSQFKSFSLTFATSGQQVSCGGTLSNTASVSSGTHDPNTSNNQSQTIATTVQCPTPTFSITKSDSRTTAAPGDALSYVITVTNTSSVQATNVTVTDTLPSQVTFVSATDGGTHLNQVVTWTGVTLAPGGTRTLSVNVTVNQSATNGTVLTNIAQVGGNGPSATDTTTVQTAQQFGCIEILKETFDTNNNVITPVAQFTFTLDGTRSVQNDSLGKARFESVPVGSHVVTETLPSSWTQVSVTPAGGNVTVNAGSSCATVVFKNRQTLTAGGTPTFTITKTDGRSDVRPGETLTYSITVTNTSSVQATNVTVTDILPSLVTYVSASDSPSVNGGVITWSNLTIAAGASRTFTVTATVQNVSQTTVLTNIAQVQNQTATDTTTVIRDTQPPVHPPVYPPVYPPVQPPHYPPVQPPHYPPVQPPIGKPYPYPIPKTGDNVASGLYVTDENGEQYLTAENAPESRSLATYIAIFATTIASAVTAAGTMIVKFI